MPYITKREREKWDEALSMLLKEISSSKTRDGDINYIVTQIVHHAIRGWGVSYNSYNTLIGVLECAKLELYRRKVALYEDEKIEENGDL